MKGQMINNRVKMTNTYVMCRGCLDNETQIARNSGPDRGRFDRELSTVTKQVFIFNAVHDLFGLRDSPAGRQGLGDKLLEERSLDRRGDKLKV